MQIDVFLSRIRRGVYSVFSHFSSWVDANVDAWDEAEEVDAAEDDADEVRRFVGDFTADDRDDGRDLLLLLPSVAEPVFSMSARLVSTYCFHLRWKLSVSLAATPSLSGTRSAEIEMVKSPPYEQIPMPNVPLPAWGGSAVQRTTSCPASSMRCLDGHGTFVTTAVKGGEHALGHPHRRPPKHVPADLGQQAEGDGKATGIWPVSWIM